MYSNLNYQVNSKENVYFYIRLFASLGLYYLFVKLILASFEASAEQMATVYVVYFYLIVILLFMFFRFGILIGHLKGNAVKLSKNQFPDIYQVAVTQTEQLGLRSVPAIYIMQSGGVLNAFAARFLGRNYVVLYSEIVETAYEQDKTILEFIIGHELGHIKRQHMLKNLLLMPSYLIPFLGAAYSRACEYTCDNIGYALSPAGVKGGLLLLASGKTIYKKVNLKEYLKQDVTEDGFWKWFAEKVSTHPNLTKRLAVFAKAKPSVPGNTYYRPAIAEEPVAEPAPEEKKEEDHSRYMPHY
ncbi:M48 family metallopeptidase [Gaoshiqia sp. Z1-71]|uniref:M48 family metallopeptidase n=1 Tax=Gaoshiqia hydrogeniformans TaxID=3290090 RepID=UPI003BF7DC3A